MTSLLLFSGCKNSIKNEFPHCQCLENKLSDGILHLNKGDDSLLHHLFIIGGDSCLLNFEIEVIKVGVIDLPWETIMKNIDFCSENDKTFTFSTDSLKGVLQSLIAGHCEIKSKTCSPLFFQNILNQEKGLSRDVLFSRSSFCFYTPQFPSYKHTEYNYCYENNVDYRLKKDSLKIVAAKEYLKSYKNFMAVFTKARAANRAEFQEWKHDYFHRLWQQSFDWYTVLENELDPIKIDIE
ncbi:MAG TPA: hypothetical protein PKD16_04925 [Saprospiraceae bacterium]|nr:hypothetical protein [Saprospiraceae bacterium]